MDFTDILTFDAARKTSDGFLIADVRAARTGIQIYRGVEVGRSDMDTVRVYRPEDEVFAKDALRTYAHRPVTVDHPGELVNPENWRDFAVGQTGDTIARDGEFVRVPMMLMDKAAIAAVEAGVNQISMGYAAELDWTDGETPSGEKYDAVQRNMRMNHLAIVAAARGGSKLKIGDDMEGQKMADKTRSIVVDSIPVEVPEQSAAIIEKALKDAATKVTDAEKRAADAEKTRDAEIAKRDAVIDDLKTKIVDDEALAAKVTARASLVDSARKVIPDFDPKTMTDAAIKRAVVVAKVGDEMKEKPDAYIDARFDMLVESAGDGGGSDPVRDGISSIPAKTGDPSSVAYDAMSARLRDAWKGQKGAH